MGDWFERQRSLGEWISFEDNLFNSQEKFILISQKKLGTYSGGRGSSMVEQETLAWTEMQKRSV